MHIRLDNIGKRYGLTWIFKGVNWEVLPGEKAAVTGHNGSGKSTLLKVISGGLVPTKGTVSYMGQGREMAHEEIIGKTSFAAPYIELIEEMTLSEHLHFHFNFVPVVAGADHQHMMETVGLTGQGDKYVRNFSSGMKQRLRLALAFFSDTPLMILDEPTANLDAAGAQMYRQLVEKYAAGRTVIIGSNQPEEYSFCEKKLDISQS